MYRKPHPIHAEDVSMKVTPTIMAGQTSAGQSPPWPYLGKRVVLVRFVTPKLPATSVRVDQARLKGPLRRGCLGESGEVTCGSFCCDGRSRLRIHWGGTLTVEKE